MVINDPEVLAEVTAAFERYEAALTDNDLDALDAMFWSSPHALRYGIGENLYGVAEIAAFRLHRKGGSPPRRVLRSVITTFGQDFATASMEFQRDGATRIGRQTQVWVRLQQGWRVTSGHVSFMADVS